MTWAPCVVPRHLRKSSSAPMRKVLPSWSSLSFWARKSNCRTSRGKPQMNRADVTTSLSREGAPSWPHGGLTGAGD